MLDQKQTKLETPVAAGSVKWLIEE